jgi:catechol 2,3-dioxygenase-like lactoylglutathione lyase family enzyme
MMKISKFFHVAIEVPDLDKAIEFYTGLLSLSLINREKLPEKKLEVAFVAGEGCEIELMCYEDSKDRQFAPENQSHFQHLSFLVNNIDTAMNYLKEKGIELESEEPIPVFNGRVCYNTFKGPGGELLEIAQIMKR